MRQATQDLQLVVDYNSFVVYSMVFFLFKEINKINNFYSLLFPVLWLFLPCIKCLTLPTFLGLGWLTIPFLWTRQRDNLCLKKLRSQKLVGCMVSLILRYCLLCRGTERSTYCIHAYLSSTSCLRFENTVAWDGKIIAKGDHSRSSVVTSCPSQMSSKDIWNRY